MCLWTGSRVGAVAQLRREDVDATDPARPMLNLTPEAGDMKGDARTVPLHPRLVELGFLRFVAGAEAGPLFFAPGQRRKADAKMPQADLVARTVAEWVGGVVADPNLTRPVHAIRHRFMTCARRAGVEEQYVEAIAGHSPGTQGRDYGEFPAAVLHREIARLDPAMIEGRG